MNSKTTRRLTAVAAVLTVGVLAGCQDTGQVPGGGSAATPTSASSKAPSGGSTDDPDGPHTETAPPGAVASARRLTLEGLKSASHPAMCGNPAGQLKDGKATYGRGSVTVNAPGSPDYNPQAAPTRVDLDGDGQDELVAEFSCDAGGVTWPSVVVVYREGWFVQDSFSLGQLAEYQGKTMTKGRIDSWYREENDLVMSWLTAESGPVPNVQWTGRVVATPEGGFRIAQVTGGETPSATESDLPDPAHTDDSNREPEPTDPATPDESETAEATPQGE
ncbi:hypothetical protein FB554_3301 [Barrientosiimonas humi]|uniref:Lipoprotein n=1 Tax=Barrientosiimonas humi TaxID=999931 RepID=A0A542WZJ1_9MICO|nr:hypothetical protein [Barrientosiimonas humi]TQL28988.1 hypothetical protein FB554_3301 [Barrientosiimonas humi]CAG7571436.1 hypothetical protein BH39T_PBIAJDOK_00369 [Barrientosiimonas humi]